MFISCIHSDLNCKMNVIMNLGLLRKTFVDTFNLTELKNLCFDLDVRYERLAGNNLDDKVRNLLEYCRRYKRLDDLLTECRRVKPDIGWQQLFE